MARSWPLGAAGHSAKLIAEALGYFRVTFVPEPLGEFEELLLVAHGATVFSQLYGVRGSVILGVSMAVGIDRITIEPGKRGGKPCVRGLRITVWDILGWLGSGVTEAQILEEHPDVEQDDFPAVYQFAAETGRRTRMG